MKFHELNPVHPPMPRKKKIAELEHLKRVDLKNYKVSAQPKSLYSPIDFYQDNIYPNPKQQTQLLKVKGGRGWSFMFF